MPLGGRGLLCLGSGETEAPMCSGFPRATEAQGKNSNRPGRLGWSSDHLVPLGLLKSSGHLWMFTLNVSGSCLCLCVGSRGPACCVPCGQRREPWGSGPGMRSWAPCCPDWGPPALGKPFPHSAMSGTKGGARGALALHPRPGAGHRMLVTRAHPGHLCTQLCPRCWAVLAE